MRKMGRLTALGAKAFLALSCALCYESLSAHVRRDVSETDAITMRAISGPGASSNYGSTLARDFAVFSPDGSKFAITLKKGDLHNNTNRYSLLLYYTSQVFRSPKPVVLVSLSSSSNREAIKEVTWLADNNTILFLGEHSGERTQLYSIWCPTRRVTRLSSHTTNLVAYSADQLGHTVIYSAVKQLKTVINRQTLRYGFRIIEEAMADVIAGEIQDDERELYVWKEGRVRRLFVPENLGGKVWGQSGDLFLSPDGRELVVKTNLTTVPSNWTAYGDSWVHRGVVQYRPPNSPSWIFRYSIINVETGHARVLLDSPVSYSDARVRWSLDSHSVAISGVFLPLQFGDVNAETADSKPFAVEINVTDLSYSKITDEPLSLVGWDKGSDCLMFEQQPDGKTLLPDRVCYQMRGGQWFRAELKSHSQIPLITTEQDLNTPPRIVATVPGNQRRSVLLNLNPQFADLQFGKVEEISFRGAGDRLVRAGLYFPPDYTAGKLYPLVLQTHGFDPEAFWIDGPYPTAFAAQALASAGILVLQLPTSHDWVSTPEEGPKMLETFKAAIDCVESKGMVDHNKIGIIGFSRTAFHVQYALTHSRLAFGAAVVADGSDGGYSQYLQFLNGSAYTASDSEALNGGLPFGPAMASWLERSPEFAMDKVKTPIMIQALNPRSLSFQWATYVALKRLGKPVDLIYLPTAQHILQKPWERLVSQQGVVDWFAFWLLGREDPNPAKAEQYIRWRELKELQSLSSESEHGLDPAHASDGKSQDSQ